MAAGSDARGELYNDDPVLQDARLCGTTASLCGLETSLQAKDPARIERAIQKILMLNAYLFIQSGIPVIYSGDEIGQLNDYSYKDDPDADRAADSRYVHRGHFRWELEKKRAERGTVQNRIFEGMQKMEKARFACGPFSGKAAVWTYDTYNSHVLCICRQLKNEMVVGVFNFSDEPQTAWIDMGEMPFQDLLGKGECVYVMSSCPAMATAGIIKPGRNKSFWCSAAPAFAGAAKEKRFGSRWCGDAHCSRVYWQEESSNGDRRITWTANVGRKMQSAVRLCVLVYAGS